MHVKYVMSLCMYAAVLLGPLTLPCLLDGSLDLGPGFGGLHPESTEGCSLFSPRAPTAPTCLRGQPSGALLGVASSGRCSPSPGLPVAVPLAPCSGCRSFRGSAPSAPGCSVAPPRSGKVLPFFDGFELGLNRGCQVLLP